MTSASYAVTSTSVYTDSEPGRVFWGADEELSNGGSPRVIVYGYDGLPMRPDEDEEDEEEDEEEHLAPVDFAIVIPSVELVSPPEGTEPVITPPFTDTTTTGARSAVQLQAAISLPPEAEVERLLAMPT
nr:hypothetical protein [Tanacetum cinerariifolium]